MEAILQATNLKKSYFNKHALKDITLQVEKGKILGLLGPNGSGKTTFMKMAAGLLKPTAGKILIDGQEPGIYTKSIVAYLPDTNYLYKWMKVHDSLAFFDDLYGDFNLNKAKELLEFMKLSENDKITTLSKGMLEKLLLTLVLSRRAQLYILDEPLGGIDPAAREKIIDALINNFTEDSSMIISTHLVRDIERLFDEVVFIADGEIIKQGNAEDLRLQHSKSIDQLYMEVFA